MNRRLLFKDVERCPGNEVLLQRPHQGIFVHDDTASRIHEKRGTLHAGQRSAVEHMAGLLRRRCVHGHHVGADQQLVERHVMLREHRRHAERRGFGGHRPADSASTDDAELLPPQFHAEHEVQRPPAPFSAANEAIAFGDTAGKRQDQAPGQLRRRFGQNIGCVGKRHAARLHRRNVDVVVTNGNVGDDLQIRKPRIDDGSIDSIGEKTDQPLLTRDPPLQLVRSERQRSIVQIDIAGGSESGKRG